jgi:Protein of unknown function (DUF3667)
VVDPWVCPTCRSEVLTPFCAQCGERPIKPRDLTLRGVFERLLHALTSVDGRLLRTFWRLLRQPGTLTVAYMDGARKPHTPPFQLFLVANVFFFAIQSLTNTNIFGASLDSHLHHQDWSALAQTLLDQRLAATHRGLEGYAPLFDRSVILNAKALVILMVLPFAALLPLAFWRSRKPFMAHLIFSVHLYAFLMLLFSVAVLAAGVERLFGGAGLGSPRVDNVLSVINLVVCAAYLYLAIGPAYSGSRWARAGKAVLLVVAATVIVLGYRFTLFLITLYST